MSPDQNGLFKTLCPRLQREVEKAQKKTREAGNGTVPIPFHDAQKLLPLQVANLSIVLGASQEAVRRTLSRENPVDIVRLQNKQLYLAHKAYSASLLDREMYWAARSDKPWRVDQFENPLEELLVNNEPAHLCEAVRRFNSYRPRD